MIFDVEPLVAYWAGGQDALDEGAALVLGQAVAVPGVQVVCFTTNSARRPSAVPGSPGVRVVYLASARKPLRTAPYRGNFPRPGVVIGDQVATDGMLARRLGYTFLYYRPGLERVPVIIGPRSRAGEKRNCQCPALQLRDDLAVLKYLIRTVEGHELPGRSLA